MFEWVNTLRRVPPNVLVVGSANTDIVAKVPRLPTEGESLRGNSLSIVFGGKGANQAVALARIGARVEFISAVGGDYYGRLMKNNFKREGILTSAVRMVRGETSGTALIFVDEGGRNSIVVIPGANHRLLPEDMVRDENHFVGKDIYLTQLELLPETVEVGLVLAKKNGLVTIVDAGPPRNISDKVFPYIDLISPNETETEFLVGIKPITKKDYRRCAGFLLKKGVRAVVLKLGAKGCYYADDTQEVYVPGFKIKPVDTTAAGDAFTAGLAFAWGKASLEEVLLFANSAGALACMKFGAQPSMPYLDEVKSFLNSIRKSLE
ncbi:MAG: ribokinase [Candidatus Hydrogenedentes bacterium]|nr:ribokinase [Candidatus Hydrogenedentota bacterium]